MGLTSKEEIINKISFICRNTVIRYGKSHFRLERGLPQGLSISSVLSSFYYAILEAEYTRHLIRRARDTETLQLVLRLTDDYLIISESEEFVSECVQILLKMSKESNFRFNSAKFKSNFKMFKNQEKVHEDKIQWIGKTIDLKTMELEHLQIVNRAEAFYTVSAGLIAGKCQHFENGKGVFELDKGQTQNLFAESKYLLFQLESQLGFQNFVAVASNRRIGFLQIGFVLE